MLLGCPVRVKLPHPDAIAVAGRTRMRRAAMRIWDREGRLMG